MFQFCYSWKRKGFLSFSGCIEMEHCTKMSQSSLLRPHDHVGTTWPIMSSRVLAQPWNIDLTPFYQGPLKKFQICQTPPLWATPSKFWRTLSPPPPLKCTLVQNRKNSFFKEKKDFISNHEITTDLNVEISIYSCKI